MVLTAIRSLIKQNTNDINPKITVSQGFKQPRSRFSRVVRCGQQINFYLVKLIFVSGKITDQESLISSCRAKYGNGIKHNENEVLALKGKCKREHCLHIMKDNKGDSG